VQKEIIHHKLYAPLYYAKFRMFCMCHPVFIECSSKKTTTTAVTFGLCFWSYSRLLCFQKAYFEKFERHKSTNKHYYKEWYFCSFLLTTLWVKKRVPP